MVKILSYVLTLILLNQHFCNQTNYLNNTLGQARHFQSQLRTNFYGVNRNPSKSYQLFKKAAEQGDSDAAYNLGYMSYRGDGIKASRSEAMKWWSKASDSGHLAATYQLAHLLKQGSLKDRSKSCDLFEKSFKAGLHAASFEHGLCALKESNSDACKFFEISHKSGFPEGTYNYAWCLHKSMPRKAEELLREAFDKGLVEAANAIYLLSQNESLDVLQKGAKLGNSEAHYLIYSHNSSHSKTDEAAISHLVQSAKMDNADAQFELGQLNYDGQIAKGNYEASFYWWNRAALQGHAAAQFNLGHSYLTGRGVEADIVLAASWFSLAARRNKEYKAHVYLDSLLSEEERLQVAQLLEEGLAGFNTKREKQLAKVIGDNVKKVPKLKVKKEAKQGSDALAALFKSDPTLAVKNATTLAEKGDGIAQLSLGRWYFKQQQLTDAAKWLSKANKSQPDAGIELAGVYLAMQKPLKVLDVIGESSGPEAINIRVKALQMQGDILYSSFKNIEAQKSYLQLEKIHPDKNNFDLLSRLARIHDSIGLDMFAGGKKSEAEEILKKSLEYTEKLKTNHPDRAETYLLLAVSTGNLARFKSGKDKIRIGGAVEGYCLKAIELNPKLGRPYSILATYYWEISKLSWILKAFARSFLGKLPEKSRDDALQLYRTSLENNPNQIYGQYKMADLLIAMNRKDEAKNHLKMALKLKALSTGDQRVQKDAKALLKKIGG